MEQLKLQIELTKSRTPIYLAAVGGVVGAIVVIAAIISPRITDNRFNSMVNFATTAISIGFGGAAGLAQQNQSSPSSTSNNRIEHVEKIENLDASEAKEKN